MSGGATVSPPTAEDWAALGLDGPTTDPAAVRRAYLARLKVAGPDRDPEGFAALRRAYESVGAWHAAGSPTGATGPDEDDGDGDDADARRPPTAEEAAAADLVGRLYEHRAAGDEAGAVALLDRALAEHPPGSPALVAAEDALFRDVALQRTLSPGLFRHLVARFDWRDAAHRLARAHPEEHAILTERVAAEDWWEATRAEAAAPGGAVAAAFLAPDAATARGALPPWGLDAPGRDRARALFADLDRHGRFLITRLDGGALAALREAVEGPPLLGDVPAALAPPTAAPAGGPWSGNAVATAAPAAPPRKRRLWLRLLVGFFVLQAVAGVLVAIFAPGDGGRVSAAAEQRAALERPGARWVEFSPEPGGGTLVDWAPLLAARAALADVRYGINVAEPNAVLPLPEHGNPAMRFVAPPDLRFITLRLRWREPGGGPGAWSEVRRFDLPARPKDAPAAGRT